MSKKTTLAVILCILSIAILIPQQDRLKSAFSSLCTSGNRSASSAAPKMTTNIHDAPQPEIRGIEDFSGNGKGIDAYPLTRNESTGVTVRPAKHPANPTRIKLDHDYNAEGVLQAVLRNEDAHSLRLDMIQSSFQDDVPSSFSASKNGFVKAAMEAYNNHHHLHIYPEDVWLAILTQFSSYINAHSEELRGSFVAHEGQKELRIVYGGGSRYTLDWGEFVHNIGIMIEENVVDPKLRSWIMPAFSTTTQHDIVIANIVMMASMQKYFTYTCMMACGLPSVTLHGTKADYQLILQRIDKLRSYGEEPTRFADLLTPILKRFILSFDAPSSPEVEDFWNKIFSLENMGSGADYYTGWLNAFMYWDPDGEAMDSQTRDMKPDDYYAKDTLWLDGMPYHDVSSEVAMPGYCTVPVKIVEYGNEIKATMLAGSVGMEFSGSGNRTSDGKEVLDTVQPRTGWWLYEMKE